MIRTGWRQMGFRVLLLVPALATIAMAQAADADSAAALATRHRLNPPAGWHGPTPDELSAEPLRNELPTQYVEAKADFDGDGKEDHAALFTADDGKSEAVFVKLSSRKSDEWMIAASITRSQPLMGVTMGISVARPGVSKTVCGKGHRECKAGESPELNLKQSSIDFFKFESSASVVYWDRQAKQFQRVWTSD